MSNEIIKTELAFLDEEWVWQTPRKHEFASFVLSFLGPSVILLSVVPNAFVHTVSLDPLGIKMFGNKLKEACYNQNCIPCMYAINVYMANAVGNLENSLL